MVVPVMGSPCEYLLSPKLHYKIVGTYHAIGTYMYKIYIIFLMLGAHAPCGAYRLLNGPKAPWPPSIQMTVPIMGSPCEYLLSPPIHYTVPCYTSVTKPSR